MKSKLFLSFCIPFTLLSYAQVGIGTTTPNAALDVNSNNQGLLIPRVTLSATNVSTPIINPNGGALVVGTLVFNTLATGIAPNNIIPGYYYWNGTRWMLLTNQTSSSNPDWSIKGNSGTNATTDFLGTTDNVDFVSKTNNLERLRITGSGKIGISSTNPSVLFEVGGNEDLGLGSAIGLKKRFLSTIPYDPTLYSNYNGGIFECNTIPALGNYLNISATGSNDGNYQSNILFHTRNLGETNTSERVRITSNGFVGILTSTPTVTLEVNGSVANTSATTSVTNIIDFSKSNLGSTNNSTSSLILNGIKDGGAYTLVTNNTTTSTVITFTATGFTFRYMGTKARTTGKRHIYSIICIGTDAYVSMAKEN